MKTSQGKSTLKKLDENKPILAIESSGRVCGASVYYDDDKYTSVSVIWKNRHSDKLFDVINQALQLADVALSDLKWIAVSSGPGSFTGLRIGMSAVKGIAFGLSLPVLPVPTFEALAFQISSSLTKDTEFVILNKVNTEESYIEKYSTTEDSYKVTEKLHIIPINKIAIYTSKFLTFGNSTEKKMSKIEISQPQPESIARWSNLYGRELLTYDYDYLEPNYVKNFIVKEKKK